MTRDRLTPVLAALATVLTSWSLTPVVERPDWRAPCLLVVLGVLLVGLAAGPLRVPRGLVLPLQLGFCAVLVTALFAGDDAVWGLLPGPAALQELADLLGSGGSTISRYAAPIPSTPGISLILTLGVLGVALLVHLAAATLRSPAAAGIPLLALYAVPAAVVQDGLPARYFAAAALGWLLMLAHDASTRVLRWGRLLPRWGNQPAPSRATISNDTAALAATGRRLGVASIVLAVALPAVVPGLPDGLLTGNGPTTTGAVVGRTSLNPVLTLRDSLSPQSNAEVLRYSTAQKDLQPLRILTADRFDGETWQPATREVSRRNRASRGLPAPPGLGADVPVEAFSMHVEVGLVLDQDFLPLPYPTRRVDIPGTWLFDPTSLNVIGDRESARGQEYDVDYLAVRPTPEQLRRASASRPSGPSSFTELPDGLPLEVAQTARRVTEGRATPYDQALALQQWFRSDSRFTYSTDAPNDAGGDAVAEFLVQRKGYCVQFASAMAVMARALGIPARIGVGFLPGTADGDERVVRLTDAHAWPELYFQGVGWVRFEPTPAVRTGVAPVWAQADAGAGDPATGEQPTDASGEPTTSTDPRLRALEESENDQASIPLADPVAPAAAVTPAVGRTLLLQVGGLLLLLALAAAAPLTAAVARGRRRRAAVDAATRADASWAELHERAADLGVPLAWAWTPRRVEQHLVGTVELGPQPRAALQRLVAAVERARYARPDLDLEAGSAGATARTTDELPADLRTVLRAVASSRPRGARLQARLYPASGRTRIAQRVQHVLQRVGGWDERLARSSHRLSVRRLLRPGSA